MLSPRPPFSEPFLASLEFSHSRDIAGKEEDTKREKASPRLLPLEISQNMKEKEEEAPPSQAPCGEKYAGERGDFSLALFCVAFIVHKVRRQK